MRKQLFSLLFLFGAVFAQRSFTIQTYSVPSRVLPDRNASFSINVRNTGSAWATNTVTLNMFRVSVNGHQTLHQSQLVAAPVGSNELASISGQIAFPAGRTGLWRFESVLSDASGVFGPTLSFQIDQTCSDGIFCNGIEQYVHGACVSADGPCGTSPCFNATCEEENGRCHYIVLPGCPSCAGDVCVGNCTGKACGPDGCGNSCGNCNSGQGCVEGVCVASGGDGSCSSPLPLVPTGIASPGIFVIQGNTIPRVNEVIPTCNALSDAKDMIYRFTVPAGGNLGIEARVVGFDTFTDTVMELRRSCSNPSTAVVCSDDSTPPGGLFSRIKAMLTPGDYVLFVDGFSGSEQGPFELTVKFVANCVPQCDGSFCGDDLCQGDCGTCANGTICYETSFGSDRCNPDPCTRDCAGKACGSDGCGGSCGNCTQDQLCVYEEGRCEFFTICDNLAPVCGECNTTEYCGADCQCHALNSPRPDFVVDEAAMLTDVLIESTFFPTSSCAWFERCVGGPGVRRLLRFSSVALNQGFAGFQPPEPKTRPDLFQYSECHNHYHYQGFAIYELIDANNVTVGVGHKQGYCMEDSLAGIVRPDVPCTKVHDCGSQGISPGWADAYGSSLDCQWIDITDLPAGVYSLRVTVNPDRAIDESCYDNNVGQVQITVPALQYTSAPSSAAMTMSSAGVNASSTASASDTAPVESAASLLGFGVIALFAVLVNN